MKMEKEETNQEKPETEQVESPGEGLGSDKIQDLKDKVDKLLPMLVFTGIALSGLSFGILAFNIFFDQIIPINMGCLKMIILCFPSLLLLLIFILFLLMAVNIIKRNFRGFISNLKRMCFCLSFVKIFLATFFMLWICVTLVAVQEEEEKTNEHLHQASNIRSLRKENCSLIIVIISLILLSATEFIYSVGYVRNLSSIVNLYVYIKIIEHSLSNIVFFFMVIMSGDYETVIDFGQVFLIWILIVPIFSFIDISSTSVLSASLKIQNQDDQNYFVNNAEV